MHEELWSKDGWARLEAIDNMKFVDYVSVCSSYKKCLRCPFAILYRDSLNIERLLCVDVATRRRVEFALREGGRFVKKGEF